MWHDDLQFQMSGSALVWANRQNCFAEDPGHIEIPERKFAFLRGTKFLKMQME
jgi:hypothetical protein